MTDDLDPTTDAAEPGARARLTRKVFIGAGATGAGLLGLPVADAFAGRGRRARRLRRRRLEVVREHMSSENEHDFDVTLDTFDHPRYEIIPTGEVYDGREQVASYYRQTREAFPDQRNEGAVFRHADGAVITECYLLGTMTGPLRGIPPTGRSFKVRMTAFFLFARNSDRIVVERVYFDLFTFLQQLGLLELVVGAGLQFPADGGIPIEG